jgi:epoxide hydrolase-like predicted phosphatase
VPALQGLIVDWGGVLTLPLGDVTARWAGQDGVEAAHFRDVLRTWAGLREDGTAAEPAAVQSPAHALERGEITPAEFEQALTGELRSRGSVADPHGLLRRMLGELQGLDPDMMTMLRRAQRAGLRLALLSNSWGEHYPEHRWKGLFDTVVISGRVGMRKPEPRIYRHTAELLRLEPAACVMVDDMPHNVRGAVDVGMVGVLHESFEQTRTELEAVFDRSLR